MISFFITLFYYPTIYYINLYNYKTIILPACLGNNTLLNIYTKMYPYGDPTFD